MSKKTKQSLKLENNTGYESLKPLDTETANEYAAFVDYALMGHRRSFTALHAKYLNDPDPPSRRLRTFNEWSVRNEWQRRVLEFQSELSKINQTTHREAYGEMVNRSIDTMSGIGREIELMLQNFAQMRITTRQVIDDPRDANLPPERRRQIETIRMRVNTRELKDLVLAHGKLLRDARVIFGLPALSEVIVDDSNLKTYKTVSPDDWDTDEEG